MTKTYIITGEREIRPASLIEWAAWFETAERQVAKTELSNATISTIFLGLDHRCGEAGPPVLWETMVFGGPLDGEQNRYTSLGAAQTGHDEMVKRVKATTR
ncbi:MAG: hypothetical protein HY323_14385 [Betaproteobacteria bacterium]|nr:hypothetical protein [Betaproteobacteria bacterium]